MRSQTLIICLLLVLAVAAVYSDVPSHDFLLHHDDDDYVTRNRHVNEGLDVGWAFTRSHAANWHPLTWISHQLDVVCFGLDPRGHHAVNLVLHALNTLLLFIVLGRMTGRELPSAFVAALFAVHPLHVESVAWVAERKDLLSTFFMMLTLWAYHAYTKKPKWQRYLLVLFLFSLGLLAKPMLVTLPFVFLLLDYWPLARTGWKKLALEKVPFLLLSIASCVVTVIVQREGGAMQGFPMLERISNALVAYVKYMAKTVWPANLSPIYPHPESALPVWQPIAAFILLAAVTFLVLRYRRYRFLPTGWFFYLGTLVPVIGIVQVGNQAMADRYTYIPLIGLFIMAAFTPSKRWLEARRVAAVLVILALIPVARKQTGYWKNSIVLFTRAIEVDSKNYLAEHDLGMACIYSGRIPDGLRHLNNSVRIKPDFGVAYANLAMIHHAQKKYKKAWEYVRLSEKHGVKLDESFISELSSKAPPQD